MNNPRFPRRGALVALVAAGLVLAAPAAAQAHVGVNPDAVDQDGSAVLAFSFTHGCENSPTTGLRITMPEGLTSVSPTVDANWDVAVERAQNGLVSAVTYTARTPIPSDLRGEVSMAVRLGEDAEGTLAFPVEQQCETGSHDWAEIAEDGADPHDLDSPAPVVTVENAAGESAAHGPAPESAQESQPDAGLVLGSAGLLAGIAALIVAVLAYRRSAR